MSLPPVPFARPNIGTEEEEAVLRVLRSGWLTTGKETLAFEEEFAAFTGSRHALAVNSATSGLHLALEAAGIGPGDHVAVSPYTFTASCETMRYLGAHPLFVDIAPGSYHMDPGLLEQALEAGRTGKGPMPKAVMPVHIGGVGWEMDRIYELARHYHIVVIEDAAHSFPARLADNAPARARELAVSAPDRSPICLGSGGDIGVYSFYANKTITTGEGGMVCTENGAMAARIRIMRSHGIDRDVWNRFTTQAHQWRYAVVEPGFKYNLPDMAGALGRVQLGRADALMGARRQIVRQYVEAFRDEASIGLPPHSTMALDTPLGHSWHLFTIQVQGRDAMVSALQDLGIGTSVHYIPLHHMPYYQTAYGLTEDSFPEATRTFQGALSLPLWAGLAHEDVARVIEAVLKTVKRAYH